MPVIALGELRRFVPQGRVLFGLDVGSKSVGVAVSDVTWTIASPLARLARKRPAEDASRLLALVREREAGGLVVGLPVEMTGREGPRCQSVRAFVRNLAPVVDLPAAFWDERWSTAGVERVLIGAADLTRKRRGDVVDRAAAAWILQGALDALRHSTDAG